MAKKQKNTKRKQAIKRQKEAEDIMSEIGLKLDTKRVSIGFVFKHLGISHLTYLGINSINNACKKYAGMDICIFSQHSIPPCVQPLCPVVGVTTLSRWANQPLITTSIGTTAEAINTNASRIYYYMFDPEFIGKHDIEMDEIYRTFSHPKVTVICRHDDHRMLVAEEFNINTHDTIVPDCDVEKLCKIALMEMDDGKTQ